jgi:hypothetical protein
VTVHESFRATSWIVISLLIIVIGETAGHSRRLPTVRIEVEVSDSVEDGSRAWTTRGLGRPGAWLVDVFTKRKLGQREM